MSDYLRELRRANVTYTSYLISDDIRNGVYYAGIVATLGDYPQAQWGQRKIVQFGMNVEHLRKIVASASHLTAEQPEMLTRANVYSLHYGKSNHVLEQTLLSLMAVQDVSSGLLSPEAELLFLHCAAAECERLLPRLPLIMTPSNSLSVGDQLEEEHYSSLTLPDRLPSLRSLPLELTPSFRLTPVPFGYKMSLALSSGPVEFLGRPRPAFELEIELETDEELFTLGSSQLHGDGTEWRIWQGGAGSLHRPVEGITAFPQAEIEAVFEPYTDVLTATAIGMDARTLFGNALDFIKTSPTAYDPSLEQMRQVQLDLNRRYNVFNTRG